MVSGLACKSRMVSSQKAVHGMRLEAVGPVDLSGRGVEVFFADRASAWELVEEAVPQRENLRFLWSRKLATRGEGRIFERERL